MATGPLTLALAPGSVVTQSEPWTTPDLLGHARAEESVDLMSVCVVASQILFLLSGRRYGVRTETVRPVAGESNCGWGNLAGPSWSGDAWLAGYRRNEGATDSVVLKSPVQSIQSVKLDGQVLSSSAYALFDNRRLYRRADPMTSESKNWPVHQSLSLPDTEEGTFAITYQWGQAVPEGGKMAAQVFATELAKYINEEASAFPDRTVNVTRQGITAAVDPTPFLQGGTGLYLPDAWIKTVNPTGARRRPSIASPETIMNARPT